MERGFPHSFRKLSSKRGSFSGSQWFHRAWATATLVSDLGRIYPIEPTPMTQQPSGDSHLPRLDRRGFIARSAAASSGGFLTGSWESSASAESPGRGSRQAMG